MLKRVGIRHATTTPETKDTLIDFSSIKSFE